MDRTATQAPTIPMIPTCEQEAEISLLLAVLIIIGMIIEYISIIYVNCMRFPRPMVEHKFNNE